jgi:L-alanine-DL-glutamate epimerase-like enolase superfamily enzyme
MTAAVRHVDVSLLRHRLAKPVGGSGVASVDVVLAEMLAHDGTAGHGFGYALGSSGVPAFFAACEIAERLLSLPEDGSTPAETWPLLAAAFNRTGKGPNYLGLCGVDVAAWDLHARQRGVPLWRCFSPTPPRVPLYQSAGFGAGDGVEQTLARISQAADAGYRAVKLRVAGIAADVARVEAALAHAHALGVQVMVDVNEKGRSGQWTAFASALASSPLAWIEEPFATGELRRYRELGSTPPIAAGEHLQGRSDARPFLDEGLLAVMQPDLAMMGGLSECVVVAQEASAFGVDVAPHFLPGLFVHVAGAVDRFAWLEEFPLLEPLFEGWPQASPEQVLTPRADPGHGLRPSALLHGAQRLHHARISAPRASRSAT